MKTKFGAIVVSGSGKLGGHVFQGSGVKSVMKSKSSPLKKNTVNQQFSRNQVRSLSSMWRELFDYERASWDAQASIENKNNKSDSVGKISGFNLFLSCNLNLKLVGKPIIRSAKSRNSLPLFSIIVAFINSGTQNVFVQTTLPPGVNLYGIMLLGYKNSPGAVMKMRDMYTAGYAISSNGYFNGSVSVSKRFGFTNFNYTYYVGVRVIDDGGYVAFESFMKAPFV